LVQRLIKVEILLPKYDNDKVPINISKFRITFKELFVRFHGYTIDNSPLFGEWRNLKTKKRYKDVNMAIWILCNENLRNKRYFQSYKSKLEKRFEQESITMYFTRYFNSNHLSS
jgi:hypothetical protein